MNKESSLWLLGAGGLLGQALSRAIDPSRLYPAPSVDWVVPDIVDRLRGIASEFADAHEMWTTIWAAGAGIIGTDQEDLERETSLLAAVLSGLETSGPGVLVLTSSAGGVYGGCRDIPIDESSEPKPLSAYGRNKLVQERLVAEWADRTGGRAVIARIANLYGPGQRLSKPQGLITQICRSTLLRQPIPIYVSLDTLRDYVYVDDCAEMLIEMASTADRLQAGTTATKIVASGNSASIGSLLSEARRVLGRRPTTVLAQSIRSDQQGTALAFKSVVWRDIDDRTMTPLPVGIQRTADDLRCRLQLGELR